MSLHKTFDPRTVLTIVDRAARRMEITAPEGFARQCDNCKECCCMTLQVMSSPRCHQSLRSLAAACIIISLTQS